MPEISCVGLNRSEAPHGLDTGLGYDERNDMRALEGAHRISSLVCEVAMFDHLRRFGGPGERGRRQARERKHDRLGLKTWPQRGVGADTASAVPNVVYRLSDLCVARLRVMQALVSRTGIDGEISSSGFYACSLMS